MKKNGFTLVEMIVSFALSTVIITLLVNVILAIENVYSSSDYKTNLYIEQGNLSKVINTKFIEHKMTDYNTCIDSDFCYTFTFENNTTSKLVVSNNIITFDSYTYKLDKTCNIVNPILTKKSFEISTGNNTILNIKIPIICDKYSTYDFGLNFIYQYRL